jgi:hypothetical protein
VSMRRWAEFLLPDALGMQVDWLRDFVRGDRGLLAQIAGSPTARRLLNRNVYRQHKISVPGRVQLSPQQQWLLLPHAAQVALARRLGLDALHESVRTTVRATSVAALRKELGDDGYRRVLAGRALPVSGLDRAAFDAALERGNFADYAVAVGAALLETTTQPGDPFCNLRMRFAFSPTCWRMRPRDIAVDREELARRIGEPAQQ